MLPACASSAIIHGESLRSPERGHPTLWRAWLPTPNVKLALALGRDRRSVATFRQNVGCASDWPALWRGAATPRSDLSQ